MEIITSYEEVDFELLKNSNAILYKWRCYFNIPENEKMNFFIDMYNNKRKFVDDLEQDKIKEFEKDYSNMFYALQVENTIINKFYHMVLHMIKKLRIYENRHDHYMDLGLLTIRSAVWSYRQISDSNIKFSTYCYNGLLYRMRGENSKIYISQNRKRKLYAKNYTDISKQDLNYHFQNLAVSKLDDSLEQAESVKIIKDIISKIKMDEDDMTLFSVFIERDSLDKNWNKKYMNYFIDKYNKTITKQAIYNKLFKIQKKIWVEYAKNFGIPTDNFNYIFLNNSATRQSIKRKSMS